MELSDAADGMKIGFTILESNLTRTRKVGDADMAIGVCGVLRPREVE